MGWETLNYACGHTETKQIYGPMADRARTVAAAAKQDCPACRATAATADATAAGLVTIVGSDKQVAWAAEIRGALLAEMPAAEAQLAAGLAALEAKGDEALTQRARADAEKVRAAMETIRAETRASWWIDHRGAALKSVLWGMLRGQ